MRPNFSWHLLQHDQDGKMCSTICSQRKDDLALLNLRQFSSEWLLQFPFHSVDWMHSQCDGSQRQWHPWQLGWHLQEQTKLNKKYFNYSNQLIRSLQCWPYKFLKHLHLKFPNQKLGFPVHYSFLSWELSWLLESTNFSTETAIFAIQTFWNWLLWKWNQLLVHFPHYPYHKSLGRPLWWWSKVTFKPRWQNCHCKTSSQKIYSQVTPKYIHFCNL